MLALLSPKLWMALAVAAVLAFSHAVAYRAGRANVRAAWDRDTAQRTAQSLAAEQAARAREQALQTAKTQVEIRHAATKKKAESDAAVASTELGRLRDTIAAIGQASPDTTAAIRADDAARARDVLGSCINSLANLAGKADRIEVQLVGLQDYVKNVCTADLSPAK